MKNQNIKNNGYQMSQEELRQVQMVELEMLIEVSRICKKCGIHYCISAGTMLGAIRHGGFIPWDDDADVAMLRSEYEKFRVACETELDQDRFYFQDYRNTKGYRWGYGKLRRKGTEFIRLNQEYMPYEQGIFIDIMPYDYVPENRVCRYIHCFESFLFRKTFWSAVGRNSKEPVKRMVYSLLYRIPEEKLYGWYTKFIERSNRKKSRYIRILTFPVPGKQMGYRTEWFLKIGKVMFEGESLAGMKEYDAYLSYKYGNYMELPPEGSRKTHPISKLTLIK